MTEHTDPVETLAGAMAMAFTAQDPPVFMAMATIRKLAETLVAYGIRQTDEIAEECPPIPKWMMQGLAEQSTAITVTDPAAAPSQSRVGARVGKAPALPVKTAKRPARQRKAKK